MEGTDRRRWARVLLVLAVVFGVVAMHSTIAPTSMAPATASVQSAEHGASMPGAMPMPVPMSMPDMVMHLCLAILAAAIVLGLLAVASLILFGHELAPRLMSVPVGTRPSRPPRRSALRLAELCVLRN